MRYLHVAEKFELHGRAVTREWSREELQRMLKKDAGIALAEKKVRQARTTTKLPAVKA